MPTRRLGPFDDQVLADLENLGVLKENGKELLRERVVFSLFATMGVRETSPATHRLGATVQP